MTYEFVYYQDKYRGLMTKYEKDLIQKIQLTQLISQNPWIDDFYFQIYTSLRKTPGSSWQQQFLTTRGSGTYVTNSMQNQMLKIIEQRKQRREAKAQALQLQGALGKISSNSYQKPKQAIEIQSSQPKEKDIAAPTQKVQHLILHIPSALEILIRS